MKNVKEILKGNIREYEALINLLYQVQEVTGENMETVVAKLDDMYDGKPEI